MSDAVVTSTAELLSLRQQMIDGADEQGRAFCHRLAAATDEWLTALHRDAVAAHPGAPPCALVAIGGYGRGELAPFSDLDVLLVHESDPGAVEEIAAAIWYPIWDAGISLGHAVRTLDVGDVIDDISRPFVKPRGLGSLVWRAGDAQQPKR